jgi:hypothetical protein
MERDVGSGMEGQSGGTREGKQENKDLTNKKLARNQQVSFPVTMILRLVLAGRNVD